MVTPTHRPYYVYDATISYPTGEDTIPTWVAILIPFIMLFISILICEFILLKEVRARVPATLPRPCFTHTLEGALQPVLCASGTRSGFRGRLFHPGGIH